MRDRFLKDAVCTERLGQPETCAGGQRTTPCYSNHLYCGMCDLQGAHYLQSVAFRHQDVRDNEIYTIGKVWGGLLAVRRNKHLVPVIFEHGAMVGFGWHLLDLEPPRYTGTMPTRDMPWRVPSDWACYREAPEETIRGPSAPSPPLSPGGPETGDLSRRVNPNQNSWIDRRPG